LILIASLSHIPTIPIDSQRPRLAIHAVITGIDVLGHAVEALYVPENEGMEQYNGGKNEYHGLLI
jgi:hypothetical protein